MSNSDKREDRGESPCTHVGPWEMVGSRCPKCGVHEKAIEVAALEAVLDSKATFVSVDRRSEPLSPEEVEAWEETGVPPAALNSGEDPRRACAECGSTEGPWCQHLVTGAWICFVAHDCARRQRQAKQSTQDGGPDSSEEQ